MKPTEITDQPAPKRRLACVQIAGKPPIIGEIVNENSKGYTIRTGTGDSPATEWFARESALVTTHEL